MITGLIGLVGIGGTIAAPLAHAQTDVTPERVAGVNRFDTAAKIAASAYPTGAATVILANGRNFPDALAGSALGGAKNAPLLLTETATTPTETTAALQSLKPTTVYLLGGTAAISQAQQDELAKTYTIHRLAGADRYATAGAIADEIGLANVALLNGKRTAFIATGLNFADALAGGPLAAAGAGPAGVHPVLLVNNDVPAATDSALTRMAIQQVVVLGGTSAVSAATADKLATKTGSAVVRYAGTDRYDTATKVAAAGLASYGLSAADVLLASGADFADALAAGPFGFKRTAPLVLTEPTKLPPLTASFLEDNSAAVQKVTAVGGTAAVSAAVLTAAEKAAETPSNDRQNEGIQVSPQSAETVPNSGSRAFTASNITSPTVDIVIVPCQNVSNENGSTKFVNSNGGNVADGTNKPATPASATAPDDASVDKARISSVNGTPFTDPVNDYANNVAPQNGLVTFEVAGPGTTDSTSITCVVPVVFQDTNGDDSLNVNGGNPATPSERFGTGGDTTFGPSGATSGNFDVNVTGVSLSNKTFTGCDLTTPPDVTPEVSNSGVCSSFTWKSTDEFQMGDAGSTATSSMTQFETFLSAGDDIVGTYSPSGQSTFRLVDEVPVGPTGITAAKTANAPAGQAHITWSASASTSTTGYNVYRSPGTTGTTCPDFSTASWNRVGGTATAGARERDDTFVAVPSQSYCWTVTAVVVADQTKGGGTRGESPAGTPTSASSNKATY